MSDTYTPTGQKPARSKPATIKEPQPVSQTQTNATAQSDDQVSRRIEEIRAKRSNRTSLDDSGRALKLSIPEDKKDPRFTYRMVLDTGNRIHDLKSRDWEVAPGETAEDDDRNVGAGTVIERMGNTRTPKPERHVLMRKPKEFYEEDKAREQAKIKKDEEALRRGSVKGSEGLSGPGSYVPAGGMKIET